MIYLLKSGPYIKIGYTKNIEARKKAYRTHNPNAVWIDIKDGDQIDESNLHQKCKKYKYDTEWFFDDPEIRLIFKEYIPTYKERLNVNKKSTNFTIKYEDPQEKEIILYWQEHLQEYIDKIDLRDKFSIGDINWIETMYITVREYNQTYPSSSFKDFENQLDDVHKTYETWYINKWVKNI